MASPTLIVSGRTSLAELQKFAGSVGDAERVRGRDLGNGTIELYAKPAKDGGSGGVWNRMTANVGASAQARSKAQQAVRMVLDNTERSMGGGAVLDDVRKAMGKGIKSLELKGEALKSLSNAAGAAHVTAYEQHGFTNTMNKLQNRGPGLDKLPQQAGKDLVTAMRNALDSLKSADRNDPDKVAARIETAMNTVLSGLDRKDPVTDKLLTRLALSTGSALKFDLRKALDEHKALSGPGGRAAFDKAFDNVSLQLLPYAQVGNTNDIAMDEVFTKQGKLGNGAFGEVDRYDSASGAGMALKTFKPDPNATPEQRRAMVETFKREAAVHMSALGGGHDNVIGFKGVVRMADGTMAIAMELAPHGNAKQLNAKIDAAVGNGQITAADAKLMKLNLLLDIAKGLGHMHRPGKEIVHFDEKLENIFIGHGGVGKQGDVGLSDKSARFDLAGNEIPAVTTQVSPEMSRKEVAMRNASRGDPNANDSIDARFKGLSSAERRTLAKNVENAHVPNQKRVEPGQVDLKAVDMWAFGNAAFQLFYGRDLAKADFLGDLANRISSFGANNETAIDKQQPDAPGMERAGSGSFAGSINDAGIEDFINHALHSDPAQRMTSTQAKDHALFTRAGVSDQRIKDLIVAVASGDDAQMRALSPVPQANVAPTNANQVNANQTNSNQTNADQVNANQADLTNDQNNQVPPGQNTNGNQTAPSNQRSPSTSIPIGQGRVRAMVNDINDNLNNAFLNSRV